MTTTLKIQSLTHTDGRGNFYPSIVYCSLESYLSAYKVHTNCKAFFEGREYWINPRDRFTIILKSYPIVKTI